MKVEFETGFHGTARLGDLIDALAACQQDAVVTFGFCGIAPTTVRSYRGFHECLALGWVIPIASRPGPMVIDLRLHLEGIVGKTLDGHKGGKYLMLRQTSVFVDNPGDAHGTGIVSLEADESYCILNTGKVI